MQLQQAVNNIFVQLAGTLEQLSGQEYMRPCQSLSDHTIGQHVRHIIELFQCLEQGYHSGTVNYEKRPRDRQIETDKALAALLLQQIHGNLSRQDRPLLLEASYDEHAPQPVHINTNYFREVAYNLEHTIHHMALIRIGIREVSTSVKLPENFGVATSTVKHKQQQQCAQ